MAAPYQPIMNTYDPYGDYLRQQAEQEAAQGQGSQFDFGSAMDAGKSFWDMGGSDVSGQLGSSLPSPTSVGTDLVSDSGLSLTSEVPGAFSFEGIGGAGNGILPVAGAIGMYDVLKNKRKGARGIGQGAASGAAMGSYFGPWGTGIGAVIGGGLGAMQRETTRDVAKRHTKELMEKNPGDAQYQNYVQGMREQYNSAPPDPSHPYGDTKGNKYATWDEYKKGGLDAANLTGVMGNLELGAEYTKLTPEQKIAFTQSQIDKNRYNSKKGEVLSTDLNAARSDLAELIKGGFKIPKAGTTPTGARPEATMLNIPGGFGQPGKWIDKNGKPVGGIDPGFTLGNRWEPDTPRIPRSKTSSPGIGKDGKRIRY